MIFSFLLSFVFFWSFCRFVILFLGFLQIWYVPIQTDFYNFFLYSVDISRYNVKKKERFSASDRFSPCHFQETKHWRLNRKLKEVLIFYIFDFNTFCCPLLVNSYDVCKSNESSLLYLVSQCFYSLILLCCVISRSKVQRK